MIEERCEGYDLVVKEANKSLEVPQQNIKFVLLLIIGHPIYHANGQQLICVEAFGRIFPMTAKEEVVGYLIPASGVLDLAGVESGAVAEKVVNLTRFDVVRQAGDEEGFDLGVGVVWQWRCYVEPIVRLLHCCLLRLRPLMRCLYLFVEPDSRNSNSNQGVLIQLLLN